LVILKKQLKKQLAAIISGHIRLIFGNFYYFCPDACHTASRPVPVTQGWNEIQTERVTDGRQVIYQSIAELIGLTRL